MQTSARNNRFRLKPHEVAALQKLRETETRNVLVIGDLHEPFCLDGYLDWCLEQYETFNCNQVIFIGDILDNHAFSYHEPDVNGDSAGLELEKSIKKIDKRVKELEPSELHEMLQTPFNDNDDIFVIRCAELQTKLDEVVKEKNQLMVKYKAIRNNINLTNERGL